MDDLQPGVTLAHELIKHVPREKIVCPVPRGEQPSEIAEARQYLTAAGYEVLEGELPEQVGYRRASDEGKAAGDALSELESAGGGPRAKRGQQNQRTGAG